MTQSTSWTRPSAASTPSGRSRAIGSVTSSTLSRMQRGQEVRAEQDPLAAERVVRPDLAAQVRAPAQLAAHEQVGPQAGQPSDGARMADGRGHHLEVVEQERPPQPLDRRHPLDQRPPRARVRAVATRHEPVARALEDGQLRGLRGDLGDELDRARARADHRHPLAAQIVAVVPPGRVEAVARELALERRDGGLVQLARGEDQRVRKKGARLRSRVPLPVAPRAVGDVAVRDDQAVDPVLADDLVEVGQDVGLERAQPLPVAALGERERVEVARDVAGGAGVGVVEPGAAGAGRLLEDRDVLDPVAAELDRRGDAAEAGADDEHAGHLPDPSTSCPTVSRRTS